VVLFVCPHGAGKSRLAAAYFSAAALAGWLATSAGQHPAPAVSARAVALAAGTPAGETMDDAPPRPIGAVPAPDRVIGIDCDAPGAVRWTLDHQELGEAARDDLRRRAEALARGLEGRDLPAAPGAARPGPP
jgi:protein-tyrosine-phosphatase